MLGSAKDTHLGNPHRQRRRQILTAMTGAEIAMKIQPRAMSKGEMSDLGWPVGRSFVGWAYLSRVLTDA